MEANAPFHINCKRCDKRLYFASFLFDSKDCTKGNCWGKCQKAREEAAKIRGCAPEDFLVPDKGRVGDNKEPVSNFGSDTSHGRWIQGRWVPWGASAEDADQYYGY